MGSVTEGDGASIVSGMTGAINEMQRVSNPGTKNGESVAMQELSVNKSDINDEQQVAADQVRADVEKIQQESSLIKQVEVSTTKAEKNVYAKQMNFEQKVKSILSDFGLG
jgi:hypothetical protein